MARDDLPEGQGSCEDRPEGKGREKTNHEVQAVYEDRSTDATRHVQIGAVVAHYCTVENAEAVNSNPIAINES